MTHRPQELARYFDVQSWRERQKKEGADAAQGNWKYSKERRLDSRSDLKRRITALYDIIFTACQSEKVTHPCLIPMGLGVFLPRIKEDEVKSIYFEAQFELLSSKVPRPGPRARVVAWPEDALAVTQHWLWLCMQRTLALALAPARAGHLLTTRHHCGVGGRRGNAPPPPWTHPPTLPQPLKIRGQIFIPPSADQNFGAAKISAPPGGGGGS